MVKQMPLPKDYAIFLIRRADGSLDLVDEEPPLDALDPDDTTEPPLPPKPTVPRYPLIVRNVTKSADIESINFGDVSFGNYVYGNMNDQKTFELEAKDYEPTFVSYKLHDGTTGESVHNTVGPRVTVIDKNVTADSASWHLLFLYFYLSTDGTYKITQRWPPEMNDVDSEGNNTGNYDDTRIRVLNTVSATYVTAISLVKNSGAYTVGSDNFIPAGVIGTGFDMNRDSKVAVYEPGGEPGFGPFAGEPYDVVISMVDERYNSSRPGQILVRRKALNLWLGNTHNIKITDSDVNEGGDVVIIPPQPGSYTVTANGGPPAAITANEYQTTQLTFTFDSAPAVLSLTDIQKINGTTAITSLTQNTAVEYVANVTVANTEVLQLKVNKSQVTT
jgi:hypothetical protein